MILVRLVLMLPLGLLLVGCDTRHSGPWQPAANPQPPSFSIGDVTKITLQLNGQEDQVVECHDAPAGKYSIILDAIRGAQHDPQPAKWMAGGTLIIETKNNRQSEILVYVGAKETTVFESGGYFNSPLLYNDLREACGVERINFKK